MPLKAKQYQQYETWLPKLSNPTGKKKPTGKIKNTCKMGIGNILWERKYLDLKRLHKLKKQPHSCRWALSGIAVQSLLKE